jgi:hypothetical protein
MMSDGSSTEVDVRYRISATIVGVAVLLSASLSAHHSFTSFWYMDKIAEIEGVVTEVKLVNPHPLMKIEVTEKDGTKSVWSITGRATGSGILRAGWTDKTLPVGTKVKVEGLPSRQEGAKALAAGKITMLDNGQVVWFGGGGGIPQG